MLATNWAELGIAGAVILLLILLALLWFGRKDDTHKVRWGFFLERERFDRESHHIRSEEDDSAVTKILSPEKEE